MTTALPTTLARTTRSVLLPLAMMTITLISYAGETLPVRNSVVVTKNLNNRKHKIKLFAASDYKTLLFTVDGVHGKHYTLFVFDLEGKLVSQSDILNRETGILPKISAGNYLYEVLLEDQKIESGLIKIN